MAGFSTWLWLASSASGHFLILCFLFRVRTVLRFVATVNLSAFEEEVDDLLFSTSKFKPDKSVSDFQELLFYFLPEYSVGFLLYMSENHVTVFLRFQIRLTSTALQTLRKAPHARTNDDCFHVRLKFVSLLFPSLFLKLIFKI